MNCMTKGKKNIIYYNLLKYIVYAHLIIMGQLFAVLTHVTHSHLLTHLTIDPLTH